MKWVVGGILAASLLFGGTTMAGAVDFRFQGEILFGTGFLSSAFITERNGQRTEAASADKFATLQRFRLQMEAIASETLSSLLCLEVGDNLWGNNESFGGGGAALGTDGQFVKVRHAFMNWTVPAPHTAGGSSILVAGIVAGILVSKLRKLGVNPKVYFKAGD